MRSKWLKAAVLMLGIAAAMLGCLDFDEQNMSVEHDEKNDRIVAVVNYRGLYSSKGITVGLASQELPEDTVEDAMAQLAAALQSETVAFFGNWPLEFPLKDLRAELEDPEEGKEFELSDEGRKNLLTLLGRVRVLNGGFYLDPVGRICGAQVLVIEEVEDSIRLVNEVTNEHVAKEMEDEDEESLDEIERLHLDAAHSGHAWVEMKGHSVIVSIPFPEEEFQEARREFAGNMVEEIAKSEAHLDGFKAVLASPVLVWHEDSMMKVKCGLQSRPSALVLMPATGEYVPNLVAPITEEHGLKLDANLARYLLEPDAAAQTEAEKAARLMAPRLTKPERIRVLVHQLKSKPGEACWAKLKRESLEWEGDAPGELTGTELLSAWEEWLKERTIVPER